jgi:hypothetical protein
MYALKYIATFTPASFEALIILSTCSASLVNPNVVSVLMNTPYAPSAARFKNPLQIAFFLIVR